MTRTARMLFLIGVVVTQFSAAMPSPGIQGRKPARYAVKIHEFEGCECSSVCPCVFQRDTTFGECRGISVYTLNGTYGATKLRNVSFVIVSTAVGPNMEKSMGRWRGVLYTSDGSTPAEREAVSGVVKVMLGGAYASLSRRTATIDIARSKDVHELRLASVGRLRIHAIRSPGGAVKTIRDAPSPLAFPVMSCAIADVDTYRDGKSEWSFAGRNGFYADVDLNSPR